MIADHKETDMVIERSCAHVVVVAVVGIGTMTNSQDIQEEAEEVRAETAVEAAVVVLIVQTEKNLKSQGQ